MVGDLNEHDERDTLASRSRSLRDFMQDWLRTLDMRRLVPDREWLGELHSTIMANPLRQARLDSLGQVIAIFRANAFPERSWRTRPINKPLSFASAPAASGAREICRMGAGLRYLFLQEALDEKAIVHFAGQQTLMGVLDTDKDERMSSTRRASVLIDRGARKFWPRKT